MRVLQVAKYYYPFLGGTEQVTRDITNALNALGVENKIICFNEDAADGDKVTRRNETVHDLVDGVEVVRVASLVKVQSQAIAPEYEKELKWLLATFRPDVVILHYPNPFAEHFLLRYMREWGRLRPGENGRRQKPFKLYVYWHLDITRQKQLKKFFHGQNIRLIDAADRILGATPIHLDESEYSDAFGKKKYLLPYMIEEKKLQLTDEDREAAARIRAEYEGKVLGFFIGRHVAYKGLKYLLAASKHVKSQDLRFVIAGEGEETAALKEFAADDPKVRFAGRIGDAERRAYLAACDIICFPSVTRSEAFGLSLAEGMYFAKPAVTFTIPGSGVNYVSPARVTGIECRNASVKELAEALDELAADPALRGTYGQAARARVLTNFTEERFRENILMLLETDFEDEFGRTD